MDERTQPTFVARRSAGQPGRDIVGAAAAQTNTSRPLARPLHAWGPAINGVSLLDFQGRGAPLLSLARALNTARN